MKQAIFAIMTAFAVIMVPVTALAHHGWSWTTGGNIDLTGIITNARLGNPHGVLTVDVEGEDWTVEVGQPWRNERAGIADGDLAPGVEIRVIGEPSVSTEDKLMKAEKIYLNGKEHLLYPNRD